MANKKQKVEAGVMERLFDDFFNAAQGTFQVLESQYQVQGVCDQVFGVNVEEAGAREALSKSHAWKTLVTMYDYAVNGIEPGAGFEGPETLVIDASDVLKLASSENYGPSKEWDNIIAMGDGRFALDEGSSFHLYKVALLANVDIRTVRNAVSAGELVAFKNELDGELYVENASARRWLLGRRGFKATVVDVGADGLTIESIRTPAEFGTMLTAKRHQIGQSEEDARLTAAHPSVTPQAIVQLEAGVFSLPLDAVFPVADYYLLDRKKFLKCVMRVFFNEEMRALVEIHEQNNI